MTALELINRLRSGEIDHNQFILESEKLSLEETEKLTSLLLQWNAERVKRKPNLNSTPQHRFQTLPTDHNGATAVK